MHLRNLVFLAAALTGIGCVYHPYKLHLRPEQLHEIEPLQRDEAIELEAEKEQVSIAPEDDPSLRFERKLTCSLFDRLSDPKRCGRPPLVSVYDVEILAESITVHGPWPLPNEEIPFSDLERVEIVWDPPERRPLFGFSLYLLGPTRFPFSLGAQWYPLPWLAVEGGVSFPIPHLGGSAWTGLRLRPIAIGPLRPFVGAFANAAAYGVPEDWPEEVSNADHSAGPRAGLELQLSRRLILMAEVDYFAYRSNPAVGLVSEMDRERFLSGGVSLTAMF